MTNAQIVIPDGHSWMVTQAKTNVIAVSQARKG